MSKKILTLIVLFFMIAIPLLSQALIRVGVILADGPGCSDIASIFFEETGLLRSLKQDYSDADYILFVNLRSFTIYHNTYSSIYEIENYLSYHNSGLRTLKIFGGFGSEGSSFDMYEHEVIFYEKLPNGRLLEVARETFPYREWK